MALGGEKESPRLRWPDRFAKERHCGNNQDIPEKDRAAAARIAKRYQERAARFEAVYEALKEGREITSLERAKEALER